MNIYRRGTGGYTIVEVIIVLTVSALLFAASVAGYNMQNQRTAFTDSVNNLAQDIQDVLNDVDNGFYPSDSSFTCTAPANGNPVIDPTTPSQQGTNTGCIFVGKAIQFAPAGTNSAALDVYTVVGRRIKDGTANDPVSVITDARTVGSNILVNRKTLSAAVRVVSVRRHDNSNLLSGIAVLTNSLGSSLDTGLNARSNLAVVPNGGGPNGLNINRPQFMAQLVDMTTVDIDDATHGIDICLRENGGRFAVISLEGGQSENIVNTHIDQTCS
jgi:type II secretory pathway pseudopilin PulG